MPEALLPSFFIAGFEASTMRRRDGRRNDLVVATRHDVFAATDYRRLVELGIMTVREGAAWHRIEARPGRYDPASVLGRVRIAEALGIQVIWDLCHFGWPDDVDPFAADFADRLAAFARWFAGLLRDEGSAVPWYAPLNEPSFVAWAGGGVGYLNPFEHGRADELKRQLVRAALAAAAAVRDVDPRARICHIDPVIHIEPRDKSPESRQAAARHDAGQFEAWDMLAGRRDDDLGGAEAELDVIGVNFYDRNEWVDGGPILRPGDPGFRPLHLLLSDVYRRYRRPIIVAETGAEGTDRVPWFQRVCEEVATARSEGVPVEGVCLYPVVDHPGWDDDRHVPVGMWGFADELGNRQPYAPLIDELIRQSPRFKGRIRPVNQQPGAPNVTVRGADHADEPAPSATVLVTDSRRPSGMGRQILTLARGLAEQRRVIVAAPDAADARWVLEAADEAGVESWALTDGSPQAQAEALRQVLVRTPVDLVNVHAGIGWEGHALVAAARRAGVATVVRTEHLPFLLTKEHEQTEYRASLSAVDHVIAVSEGVARSHVAAGVPPGLIRVVANGIDDPLIGTRAGAVRATFGIDSTAPFLVSVGRLTPQKGYDVLLAAAIEVVRIREDACFLIIGAGPLEEVIGTLIETAGLQGNVQLVQQSDDVPAVLAAADAIVLPSRFEGLPLVALEAMAVARPVVGSRVTGLDETVEDGVTGRLVAAGDASALAAAILELLADPEARARFGHAGRKRYEARFTARRMVAETDALFDELVRERASGTGAVIRGHGSIAVAPVR